MVQSKIHENMRKKKFKFISKSSIPLKVNKKSINIHLNKNLGPFKPNGIEIILRKFLISSTQGCSLFFTAMK